MTALGLIAAMGVSGPIWAQANAPQPDQPPAEPAQAEPAPAEPAPVDATADAVDVATPSPDQTPPLTEDQQRELDLLLSVAGDAKIDLDRRRDAALALLKRDWPQAREGMFDLLAGQDRAVALGVATALADLDQPDPRFIDGLLNWLDTDDAALRTAVAAALRRYENHGVTRRLTRIADDPDQPKPARLGAIEALAEHRQAEAVEALIDLTASDDGELRTAALASLRELTGMAELGDDARAWRKWWAVHRALPRDRWLARMVEGLSDRTRQLTADRAALTRRLAETYQKLYAATAEDQRPAVLQQMLSDPLAELRLAGLNLIERRVLNAQAVDDATRKKLRELAGDPSAVVRRHAVTLLRDLDDEAAVDLAIARVEAETDPSVASAYLSLMARRPKAEAAPVALRLLDQARISAAAAAVLTGADDAGVLDEAMRQQVARTAGQLIEAGKAEPAVVVLLGRAASSEDHRALIRRLLREGEPAMRRAAAEGYVRGRFDLGELLAYLKDPVLADRAIEAAARHGKTLAVVNQLLAHPPAKAEAQPAWRAAVLAAAGRLDGPDLGRAVLALKADEPAHGPLRVGLLELAMKLEPGAKGRAAMLLDLLEARLDSGQLEAAATVARALADAQLDDAQSHRLAERRLSLLIAQGDYDAALEQARRLIADHGDDADQVAGPLLDAAETELAQKKTEQAAALLAGLRQLTGENLGESQRSRLDGLQQQLARLQQTPAPADG